MFKYIALTALALTSSTSEAHKIKQKQNLLDNKEHAGLSKKDDYYYQITEDEAWRIIRKVDLDENGSFEYWEMVKLCKQYYCDKDYADIIFSSCDRSENLSISVGELI